MASEARVHVIDPSVTGKLLVVRVTAGNQLEILMVSRLTDNRLVLPGLARRKFESTIDLVRRIAGSIFVGVTKRLWYEAAARVVNEDDHPVPPIRKVFLVTDIDYGMQVSGVWVNPARLAGVIAPEEWALVTEGLRYFFAPKSHRKGLSFFYAYQGLGTPQEIAEYDAKVTGANASPRFDDFGEDGTLDPQLARLYPDQHFQPQIISLIEQHGYSL